MALELPERDGAEPERACFRQPFNVQALKVSHSSLTASQPSIGPSKQKLASQAIMQRFFCSRVTRTLGRGCGPVRIRLLHAMTNDGYVCRILAKLRRARCHWISQNLPILSADGSFHGWWRLAGHPSGPCELSLSREGTGCMSASQSCSNSFLSFLVGNSFIYFQLSHESGLVSYLVLPSPISNGKQPAGFSHDGKFTPVVDLMIYAT